MLKNFFISMIYCICFYGCKTNKTIADFQKITAIVEITYKRSMKQDVIVNDGLKIKNIISILNLAKRTPVKFICIEEIIMKKDNGEIISIKKNKQFLIVNGITFILNPNQNDQLNKLLL